jgi:hypothetical protein
MKNIKLSYTNFILTVIAALLACNILIRTNQPVVHAQNPSNQYAVTDQGDPSVLSPGQPGLEKRLNDAVKGGEIVALAPSGRNSYIVVYKPQK